MDYSTNFPEISVIKIEKDGEHDLRCESRVNLLLSKTTVEVANRFRRILLTDVPIMAFESVQIEINESPLTDEVVANRIGFIPVESDGEYASFMVTKNECKCPTGMCPRCCCKYFLNVECSDNDAKYEESSLATMLQGPVALVSSDMIAPIKKSKRSNVVVVSGSSATMVHPTSIQTNPEKPLIMGDIPITTIVAKQRIRLVAFARLGFGRDHQKWCGACAVSVKQCNDDEDIDSASDFIVHVETTGAMTIKNLVECAASILSREFPTSNE